ncbi:PAS domain S-box-containing protein [Desulfosalsimonas propionicica]|uniref:histidine kinase n=1 Tax=Desulfosalsimonas propionicica TaxID=332175 RepID=A0A7W0CCA9_9BACT|nr:PAS domain S-box protein [Desulfosalsimonas propionicica]MBA2883117.1 PAS domain S-box-containing protein [Desulfosalsimonas propionicica]
MRNTDDNKDRPGCGSSTTPFFDPKQLREQTEQKAKAIHLPNPDAMTREEIQQRFYELHVQRIEVEMQNQQLQSRLEERDEIDALFGIVTGNMLDMVALTDMEGNFTFAGKSHEILGYEPGCLIGKNVMDFVHPEDLPHIREEFGEFVSSRHPRTVEYRNRCRDGTYLWLETVGKMLEDKEGHPQKIVFSSRNVTGRKLAEDALRFSEQRFQKMLSLIPDMISINDRNMNIVYSNWNGLGAVSDEKRILQTKCYKTYRGFDDICPECQAKTVLETRESFQKEVELFKGRWFDVRVIPLLDESGAAALFVEWVRDITNRKQAEQDLRKRESLLQRIFDILPIGLWFADKNGRLLRGNPAGVAIWGTEPLVDPSEYGVFKARRYPSGEEITPDTWALARTVCNGSTISDELLEIEAFDGRKKIHPGNAGMDS